VSNGRTFGVIVVFMAVGAFILLPFFVAWMMPFPEQPEQQETLESAAGSIASQTGLRICKAGPVDVSYPGVELAFFYQLAPDCSAFTTGEGGVSILAMACSSPEELQAAQRTIQAAIDDQQVEGLSVAGSGTTLLVVKGAVISGM
jgi:hypothetical protein